MKIEHCISCDSPTGRAGLAEDSLYTSSGGPFCEECFEMHTPNKRMFIGQSVQSVGDGEPRTGVMFMARRPDSPHLLPGIDIEYVQASIADDLLAELKKARELVVKWCHYQGTHPSLHDDYVAPIDAAIAKAEEARGEVEGNPASA